MRFFLLLILILASCKKSPPDIPAQALNIHFTCDTFGRLEPCGCFTGQHGGLTRLRTWLSQQDLEGTSLRLDVGGALAGSHDYDLIQYDYLLRAYAAMGFQALNLGAREAAAPANEILKLAAKPGNPLISASIVDPASRKTLFTPYTIVNQGPRRIGILGLLDPASCPTLGSGFAVLDMPEAIERVLPELKQNSDIIIVLAFTNEAGMEQLARSYFEFDIILGGDVSQPAQALSKVNESLIAYTTNEGRTVASISSTLSSGTSPRLSDSSYSVRLLSESIVQDEELRTLVAEYRKAIRDTPLAIDQPGEINPASSIPGVSPVSSYVGSASCQSCHPDEHSQWKKSGHGRAFETLIKRGADTDPHCIGCHSIGFGEASGYRREFGDKRLVDVGCESCHGPASEHVDEMTANKPMRFRFRPLAAADCLKCHYGEFSRPFVWDDFWPKIKH